MLQLILLTALVCYLIGCLAVSPEVTKWWVRFFALLGLTFTALWAFGVVVPPPHPLWP